MSKAWKELDLEGEGLQGANIKLAAMLKKRATAYLLMALLFPLGQHRAYLEDRIGAWGYRATSLVAIALFLSGHAFSGGIALLLIGAFVVYDIRWVDNRVATLNKALRIKAYMRPGKTVPEGFKGRFTDDAESGAPAESPDRLPSFAEQEAMLKELAKRKNHPPENE